MKAESSAEPAGDEHDVEELVAAGLDHGVPTGVKECAQEHQEHDLDGHSKRLQLRAVEFQLPGHFHRGQRIVEAVAGIQQHARRDVRGA